MAELRIKTHFLIPLESNDHVPFTLDDFDALREQALALGFDSLTRVPNVTDGWWRDPADGRLYFDRCHQYEIGLESWRQVTALIGLVDWARAVRPVRQDCLVGLQSIVYHVIHKQENVRWPNSRTRPWTARFSTSPGSTTPNVPSSSR